MVGIFGPWLSSSSSGIRTEQCACFVSSRILEEVTLWASLFWDVRENKTSRQGLIHSFPSSLKQSFNNLHREEEENVLGGAEPAGGDRKEVGYSVLYSSWGGILYPSVSQPLATGCPERSLKRVNSWTTPQSFGWEQFPEGGVVMSSKQPIGSRGHPYREKDLGGVPTYPW